MQRFERLLDQTPLFEKFLGSWVQRNRHAVERALKTDPGRRRVSFGQLAGRVEDRLDHAVDQIRGHIYARYQIVENRSGLHIDFLALVSALRNHPFYEGSA